MLIVFGSLNVDMVLQLEQMPRSGETVLCPNYHMVPGGKGGNQAVAAAKSGATVKLFGKIGKDSFGQIISEVLKTSSVDPTGVSIDNKLSTGCATVCVDAQGENMIMVASGANLALKGSDIPDFLLGKESTLLLQMETLPEENWKLIRRATKLGARVILNLAPAQNIPLDILKSLKVLIMNQIEATHLALHLGFDVISPTVAARRISANFGITCIVTLGKEGAIACSPEGNWHVQAMDIKAVDTTAAGDAFVGVFAASLDQGRDLPASLQRASVASGLTCLTMGAQVSLPNQKKIEEHLKEITFPKQNS